jgi:hypothetical protein
MSPRSSRFVPRSASRALIAGLLVAVVSGVTATVSFAGPEVNLPASCRAPAGCVSVVRQIVWQAAGSFGDNLYQHRGERACDDLTAESKTLIVTEAREKFGASRPNDDTCEQAIIAYYPVLLYRGETSAAFNPWASFLRYTAITSIHRMGGFVHWRGWHDGNKEQTLVVDQVGNHWLINLKESHFASTA